MATERFLPTTLIGRMFAGFPFVFNPQDFEMHSENTDNTLFASCLITVGPFCSFSNQLDMKIDVELGARSLSLYDD